MELLATYYHGILCKNEGQKSKTVLIKNKDPAKYDTNKRLKS